MNREPMLSGAVETSGLEPVLGRRKNGKTITVLNAYTNGRTAIHADITPGKGIRLYGETFAGPVEIEFGIGSRFISGSGWEGYIFTDHIEKITANSILFVDRGTRSNKRMSIEKFAGRNYDMGSRDIEGNNYAAMMNH